ncbi:MAG TPA: hypothetical protein VKH64_11910 [Candidatus Binatia bacterium]|nr:hypothetical protein [Candidatus Binatia bacterium]
MRSVSVCFSVIVLLLLVLASAGADDTIYSYPPTPLSNFPSYERSAIEGRPWDLSIRTFVGYNDNVPMVPYITGCQKDCEKQSFYGGVSISGNFRFLQTDRWLAGVGLNFDQVGYANHIGPGCCSTDGDDYNLTAVSPNMFARYFFGLQVGDFQRVMPSSVGMTYSYRRDWTRIVGPLIWHTAINTVQWDLAVDVLRQLRMGLNYSIAFSNLNRVQSFNSRDNTAYLVGLNGTYFFQGGLRSITLDYHLGATDARGNKFDIPFTNGLKGRFQTRVVGPLWLALDAGSNWDKYRGKTFAGVGTRRWQRTEKYRSTLLYSLTEHITADLFYEYTGWVANQREFEGNRNNGGAGVTYRF